MLPSTELSSECSNASKSRGAMAAKDLTVEQKLWLADQFIDKKQSAQDLAKQYNIGVRFIYKLAERRRTGSVIHRKGGRPPGAKNKKATVKKRLQPIGTIVEVMPGMEYVAFKPYVVEAVAAPTIPEPSLKCRASIRLAGVDGLGRLSS
jgi:hypothetical protein